MTHWNSISALHDAYDSGRTRPSDALAFALSAGRANRLNTFLYLREAEAIREAQRLDETLKKLGKVPRETSPLFGVPVGVKDNLHVVGAPTTCASQILRGYYPPFSATAVERMQQAGAILSGKLNMDEFAMGSSNENSSMGPVLHPTHPDHVPGGSSGGSAASVAAGECLLSLGSDTGGSIRLPASFCGVWGLKPTYGRVSRFGLVAFGSSLDQVGPLATNASDLTIAYRTIAGHDPKDSTSSTRPMQEAFPGLPLKGLRIGLPAEYFEHQLHPEVDQLLRDRLEALKAAGAALVPIHLPHSKYSISVYYLVAVCEASSNLSRFDGVRFGHRPEGLASVKDLGEFYQTVRSQFGPEVKRRILLGTYALSAGFADRYYHKACLVRRRIADDFEAAFREVDLIVGPVSPEPAFKRGTQVRDPLTLYLNDIFTIPPNLAGLPAMSAPIGKSQSGLPIGLHVIGQAFSDEKLLAFGRAIEALWGRSGA